MGVVAVFCSTFDHIDIFPNYYEESADLTVEKLANLYIGNSTIHIKFSRVHFHSTNHCCVVTVIQW
jgi:hypothetical protein